MSGVREALQAVLKADMEARIAYHAPYGETSQEQWQFDTEKEMTHAIATDEELLDKLVAAVLNAPAILDQLTAEGHLISWTELDDGVAFDCYRLNPEKYPDSYLLLQ